MTAIFKQLDAARSLSKIKENPLRKAFQRQIPIFPLDVRALKTDTLGTRGDECVYLHFAVHSKGRVQRQAELNTGEIDSLKC